MARESRKTVPAKSEPIDRKHLARYTLGDRALEREVLQLFLGQTALYLDGLRKATALAQWSHAAHSLKGSAIAVGANRIAAAAAQAEALRTLAPNEMRASCLEEVAVAIEEANRYIGSLP